MRVGFELRSFDNLRQEVVTGKGDVSYASPSEKRGKTTWGTGQVIDTRSPWPEDGLLKSYVSSQLLVVMVLMDQLTDLRMKPSSQVSGS